MSSPTNVIAKRDNTITITGEAQYTKQETEQIRSRMSPDTDRYLGGLEKENMLLESADGDLCNLIKRAQRDLRECKEYRNLQHLKQNLKQVRAQRNNVRTKALGVYESLLSGVRKGTSLHKKIVLMLSAESEG